MGMEGNGMGLKRHSRCCECAIRGVNLHDEDIHVVDRGVRGFTRETPTVDFVLTPLGT